MLGGLKDQITQLMEIVVLPLLHPEIYQFTGVVRPRGVLLHGVPGGGKTQLVKCLAGVSGMDWNGEGLKLMGVGTGFTIYKCFSSKYSVGDVWGIGKDTERYF